MEIDVRKQTTQTIRSILLLAGAFTFAFLFGEMVHEFGHYLGHLALGNPDIQIHLDPFGGSRMVGASSLSDKVLGITAATGPLFNLILGIACFLLLWQKRRPVLLPLLLWGAVSMIQEGITFSLGFLTSGGDAEWIAAVGIPAALILTTGILCILAGIVAITLLLPLAGVEADSSYWKRLLIVLLGMGSFMLLRSAHSFIASPDSIMENLVPLIFSLLLAVIVALIDKPVSDYSKREFSLTTVPVTWPLSAWALALGTIIFLFQVIV